jgi:glucosylceramidase
MLKGCTLTLCAALLTLASAQAQSGHSVDVWLTTADRTSLFAHQPQPLVFSKQPTTQKTIDIDAKTRYQPIDGFGFALTGGSAQLLMKMDQPHRTVILKELFATDGQDIGISYLRVSIGSSDMNDHVFTYDDLPAGEQDPQLTHFDLSQDRADVIPVLKEILAINPKISILGSPWSPPSWMKTNELPKGGSLRPELYGTYAQYFVKYIHAMAAEGIRIDAITVQNEPLNPKNTPSLVMTSKEEGTFIATALGPAFRQAHLKTKIILYDHNCDRPDYPLDILADSQAAQYVAGSGFHLYGGTIDAMTKVHDAYPKKDLYFTEQMVTQEDKETVRPFRIAQPVSHILIGATRNWSRNALLWNLAADPQDNPHTDSGGCPVCQGAITIDGNEVTRNLAFYTAAHASKFVRPGSVRIQSGSAATDILPNVAFETPDHKKVLLIANPTHDPATFSVRFKGAQFTATLNAGDAATYVWH